MATVTGKVNKITSKEWEGKNLYGLEVNGKSYGTGTKKPTVVAGDYVEFEADTSGKYAKADFFSIKKIEAPAGSAATGPTGGGYRYGAGDDKKQEVISKQAARNSAIAFFAQLAALDALPTPAKTAKIDARMELYLGILDKMTTDFFDYSMGKSKAPTKEESKSVDGSAADDNWEE
jgi:hypothetical protein